MTDNTLYSGDVGQHRVVMWLDMAADPVKVAHGLGRAGDDQERSPLPGG
jgi:hypothetical protein